MEKLRVLLLGSGGREHALAWKIAQSDLLDKIFIAPGNGGTSEIGENLNIKETDFQAIKSAIAEHQIDLVVVGPEAPLVAGITNELNSSPETKHVLVLGPDKSASQLEGSKSFAKEFMVENNIPTARYGRFEATDIHEAKEFLGEMKPPYVIKADGLAAGKGVVILDDRAEAEQVLDEVLIAQKFGEAGDSVVIEEFLDGIELSVFVLTDGSDYVILPEAKDYKRIGEGDKGLNTGGMGSISPVPFADQSFMEKVEERIIKPTIKGIQNRGMDYRGFVFFGLMNVAGDPYVIEYNVRMGDPETEVVMQRIEGDLLQAMKLTAEGKTREINLSVSEQSAACVMLVSGGYPESYEKGKVIELNSDHLEHVTLFHAGTKMDGNHLKTSGGRVIAVCCSEENREKALEGCYHAINGIRFDKMNYRKDIGFDLK